MKIKINVQGEKREIEIKGIKRNHSRIWLRKMRSVAEKVKKDDLSAIGEAEDYLNFQDEQAVEFSSLTKEEFDNLEIEEANKILSAIGNLLFPQSKGESLF